VAGDLKLAYAQFEELETFARFGARLDEGTRKIIEHGRRIRGLPQAAGIHARVGARPNRRLTGVDDGPLRPGAIGTR